MNVKLLQRVKRHILAEPRRLMMKDWIRRKSKLGPRFTNDDGYLTQFPKCGTVACIAGWVVMLVDNDEPPLRTSIPLRACKLLDISYAQGQQLFYTEGWDPALRHSYWGAKNDRQRATLAAKQIDKFIKENP